MMKNLLLFLTLGLVLSANKCSDDAGATTSSMMDIASLDNAKMILQSLDGEAVQMPDGVEMPWIQLNKSDNSLTGFGGCNSLFGNFEQSGSDLSFANVGSTKKYCEGVQDTERGLMGALNATKGASLSDGLLKLTDGTKTLATFKKG